MLTNLVNPVRYFVFWLLFFLLERFTFLLFFIGRLKSLSLPEIAKSFVYGLWLDASMAAYICSIPLLVFLVLLLFPQLRISKKLVKGYTVFWVVFVSLVAVINVNIYKEWGSLISYRAFEFAFSSPGEALASSLSSPPIPSILVLTLMLLAGFGLSRSLVRYEMFREGFKWYKLPLIVGLAAANVVAIRGGLQLTPINESMAYYSDSQDLNYASVNPQWSFFQSVQMSLSANKYPYNYLKEAEATALVKELYTKRSGGSEQILKTNRPNVVLIVMEGFTADVVESLGGEKGVDPSLEKLKQEGVFFSNIYASGSRTDKGLVAILSAFPSQTRPSIIKESSKHKNLPSLYKSFNQLGYKTSFYYGGESQFTNMKSYLYNNGCETLVDKSNFEEHELSSKWGAYDDRVFAKLLNGLNKEKQPFFSTILTLTNHEPFDLPVRPHFEGDDLVNKYKSTAYYADSCIGDFVEKAKKQSWYDNTVFIAVADHGHRLPRDIQIHDAARYRIPLLFFGGAIKEEYKGITVDKIGSQTDIAATLFTQIGLRFPQLWSKNLLDPKAQDFAFYNWDNGFGMVDPTQAITFEAVSGKVVFRKNKVSKEIDNRLLKNAKAYMQKVFQQYMAY
ncbi:LTA synthase family protein [Pedobacter sp. SYSU D00535]|uniref:LTA synthase family protein n=1 Tax=Pedobacter sp. SYSU D00535 TaxID=2810308 RepID=UPI001A971B6A|nr:LTA synthase family protein [Pedobacter sp. SYSU D00535]